MAMQKSDNNITVGKQAVFNKLYAQHYGRVLGAIASRFRDQALAEDATAEAFATAYEKFATFRGESSLYTWVFAIANNAARSAARRRGVLLNALSPAFWHELPAQEHVSDSLDRSEDRARLHAALQALPRSSRQLLTEHVVGRNRVRMIARRNRLPLGTALSRIHRAKQSLRSAWNDLPTLPT